MNLPAIDEGPGPPDYKLTKDQLRASDNLISDAVHCALYGGSRSGKTFLFCRAILMRAAREPHSRHAIFRFRFNSCKTAIALDTMPKVIRLCFPEWGSASEMLDKTDWYFTLPNGAEVWISGLDDKDRVEKVLGHEYATMFFNECSQIPWKSVETALTRLAQKTENLELKAYYDLNPPSKKHWTYKRFIEKLDPETNKPVLDEFDFCCYQMNPEGNKENLDAKYLRQLDNLGERARLRFKYGMFAEDTEGALWTEELIAQQRVLGQEGTLPNWLRVIIAVDPSGTKGDPDTRSDEVGIIVCALGTDGFGYVVEDLSGNHSPETWGKVVYDAYHRHEADKIVGEVNFGGDMVRANIHAVDASLPYGEVRASRGKVIRAEPISTLFEQGKIFLVGYFPEMEDQMCAMLVSEYVGLKSPDRCDAMVWGMSELFPKGQKKEEKHKRPVEINIAPRTSRSHQNPSKPTTMVKISARSRRRI